MQCYACIVIKYMHQDSSHRCGLHKVPNQRHVIVATHSNGKDPHAVPVAVWRSGVQEHVAQTRRGNVQMRAPTVLQSGPHVLEPKQLTYWKPVDSNFALIDMPRA